MSFAFDEIQVTEVPPWTIVSLIFKPFTTATVKYFDLEALDAVNAWISE